MKKFFVMLLAMFFAGNIFAPFVHAEIKTYTGVGDYILSEDTPPGDIKSKAKMYAQKNALEQAGVFVSGLTEVKNNIVTKDEINYQEAISKFTEAINLNPNDAEAYAYRGTAYKHLGKYELAIFDFKMGMAISKHKIKINLNKRRNEFLYMLCYIGLKP